MPKGFKAGGRKPGSLNKRTVARLQEQSAQVTAIKRFGGRKATEILNELVQTGRGMVALYQAKIVSEDGRSLRAKIAPADLAAFWTAYDSTVICAKSLAPYQDAMITRIDISQVPIPGMPLAGSAAAGDAAKKIEGKVISIDDPAALARVYAAAVTRVA